MAFDPYLCSKFSTIIKFHLDKKYTQSFFLCSSNVIVTVTLVYPLYKNCPILIFYKNVIVPYEWQSSQKPVNWKKKKIKNDHWINGKVVVTKPLQMIADNKKKYFYPLFSARKEFFSSGQTQVNKTFKHLSIWLESILSIYFTSLLSNSCTLNFDLFIFPYHQFCVILLISIKEKFSAVCKSNERIEEEKQKLARKKNSEDGKIQNKSNSRNDDQKMKMQNSKKEKKVLFFL